MKEMCRLCVLFIMVVVSLASSSYAALDDGLVGFWSFDDCSAIDNSGTGNNGYFVGNNQCVPGANGSALQFNGYYDPGYVNIPNTASLSFLDNFTFTLWFNIQSNISMDGYGKSQSMVIIRSLPRPAFETVRISGCSGQQTTDYCTLV